METHILMSTEANALWNAAKSTLKIEGVKTAHTVAGEFDVSALVNFPKIDDLGKILGKIQRLKGGHGIETLIAIPRPVRE